MSEEQAFHVFAGKKGNVEEVRGEAALRDRLKAKTTEALRLEVVWGRGKTPAEQYAAELAQMELDRRASVEAHERAKELLDRSTKWTVFAVIGGAVVGAVLTALLTT